MLGLEAAYVNMDDGFVEAMLRSLRKGFLDDNQYSQLKQTSTITEFKLVLEDSDYGASVFENQDSNSDFEVALLRRQMKQKLADELRFMHS
jgi:V-type H+-transporting ATPase subunit d